MLKVYAHQSCSTCRNALKFLQARKIHHRVLAIRETPPSPAELRQALRTVGEIRKLFNSSGLDYKTMDLKSKLPGLTQEQALNLLAGNGNLVKRPFVIDDKHCLVGFREEAWRLYFQGR